MHLAWRAKKLSLSQDKSPFCPSRALPLGHFSVLPSQTSFPSLALLMFYLLSTVSNPTPFLDHLSPSNSLLYFIMCCLSLCHHLFF